MKKKWMTVFFLTVMMMAAVVSSEALALTAPVPAGTKMTHQKNVDGSYTVTVSGPVRIQDVEVYHHDGRRNTPLSKSEIGGPGAYLVTVQYTPGGGYALNGDGFNFQHLVPVTQPNGTCVDATRWSYIGYDFVGGNIPAWSDFDPAKKTGVVSIATVYNGDPGAEYHVFEALPPAIQEAFLKTFNGGKAYPRVVVN